MLAAGCLRAASLAELISHSDAIVAGTQTSLAKSGIKGASFFLPVERVFKGNMAVGSLVAVTWDGHGGAGDWTGSPAKHGIWFLRLPAELSYDPTSTSLTDQLVREIAAAQPRNPALILNLTYNNNSSSVTRASGTSMQIDPAIWR